VAALDLGGGSTQITFAPKGLVLFIVFRSILLYLAAMISQLFTSLLDPKTLQDAPKGFIHQVAALHNKISIYSFR